MSSDPTPTAWPVLGLHERRVLGVLVEKAKTTPDAYPLTLNALVTGCNQKSNRDPVLNLADVDVEEALAGVQKLGLAIRITGSGRVEKWRHNLYEAWHLDKVALAIVAELLLRGPQTEGELRGRVSRMEPVADLDALRAQLRPLVERGLVVYLSPEGRRGTMLTHGFHAPQELERLRERHGKEGAPGEAAGERPTGETRPAAADRLAALEAELAQTRAELASLKTIVAELQTTLTRLTEQLGG